MHVDTIKMDPRIAKIHYSDYMKKCQQHREKRRVLLEAERLDGSKKYRQSRLALSDLEQEDMALLAAYRALRKGQIILNLNHVLAGAGLNKDKRPNLAVARAHHKWCYLRRNHGNVRMVSSNDESAPWSPSVLDMVYYPRFDRYADMTDAEWRKRLGHPELDARALVPSVPAHLRPDDIEEGKYHILWEAVWEAAPTRDPLLLKRLDKSDFYVVLAQWDLTPLEQQVAMGKFTR
jgi:hypothetical protein